MTPILAVQPDVLGIIVLVLTILAYIVKAIKGSGDVVKGGPARPPQGDRVRTEIETFLEELNDSSRKRPPARPAAERPRPPAAKSAKKPAKPVPPMAPPKSQRVAKPVASLSQQHLPTSQLGEGLRSHLSSYMSQDRIATEVRQDMPNRIAAEVRADFGARPSAAAPVTAAPVHPVITLLRDPLGVRQAIAVQEILQKPKALRR
jgi:hypothetical protein